MAFGAKFNNNGKQRVLNLLSGALATFEIGTGTNTPTDADTALQTPITGWSSGNTYAPVQSATVIPSSNELVVSCFVAPGLVTANVTELGIGTAVFAEMDSRAVFPAAPLSGSSTSFTFILTLQLLDYPGT